MNDASNPLLDALPPATDYLSYATIVEQYVSRDNLPVLYRVLQDEKLTVNIGWDLIHVLLPLLPDSKECLLTIARLGNPREVLLKVTESLQTLELDSEDHDEASKDLPPVVNQFLILVTLLSILHARIKTKYPSRFLSTTLPAVFTTLSRFDHHLDTLLPSVIELATTIAKPRQPPLPPRQASNLDIAQNVNASDPEASQDQTPSADDAISRKLLQAFVTELVELYLTYHGDGDINGIALSDRLQEKLAPSRIVPHRLTISEQFETDAQLKSRLVTMDSLSNCARALGLDEKTMLAHLLEADKERDADAEGRDEDDPPDSPDEVPLSRSGLLGLLMYSMTRPLLTGSQSSTISVDIFPQHHAIIRNIGGQIHFGGMLGISDGVLDCLLAMGSLALHENQIGEPENDEQFNEYLQAVSLISANSPSTSIRFHSHLLATTVLRSHPDANARLSFIKDTLEHCPYENLKTAAVSWIKGEVMEANPPPQSGVKSDAQSVFSTPVGLNAIAVDLFPDLTVQSLSSDVVESWTEFRMNFSFYLASLNFYYLLLAAKYLHKRLGIKTLHSTNDIGGSFLGPLKELSRKFSAELTSGRLADVEGQAGSEQGKVELMILDDVLERIDKAVVSLNEE